MAAGINNVFVAARLAALQPILPHSCARLVLVENTQRQCTESDKVADDNISGRRTPSERPVLRQAFC